jgi:hypothetical protein
LPAERTLLDCCRAGELAIISDEAPKEATPEATIRADFARFLFLGGDEATPVHERGVRIWGAWIEGDLDLSHAAIIHPILLGACRTGAINAQRAQLKSLTIGGTLIDGEFNGDEAKCDSLFIRNGSSVSKGVSLIGAKIAGSLIFSGSRIRSLQGSAALNCDGIYVGNTVFLDEGMYSHGEVRFVGAIIRDALVCSDSKFRNPNGDALACDRAQIGGSLFLNDRFYATGTIRLNATKIKSNLEIVNGRVERKRGAALYFERAEVGDSFILISDHRIKGDVVLYGMSVVTLADVPEAWSGAKGRIKLDGFMFERLAGLGDYSDPAKRVAASTLSCIISLSVGCGKTVWMKSSSTSSAVLPMV